MVQDREKKKKKRMRKKENYLTPGFEMLKRFQYDSQYNVDQVIVVYLDRFTGLQECDLEDFIESEVPYQRIRKFKINEQIVWDRNERINLVKDGSALQYLL